jgi:hypothetical protein
MVSSRGVGRAKEKKGFVQSKPVCVFCGGHPLSKEHLWPDWMDDFFPGGLYRQETSEQRGPDQAFQPEPRQMEGGPWKTAFKAVCEPCNNGWMSQIESGVKDTLLALGRGHQINLGLDQQEQLARWVAMKAMVAENGIPKVQDARVFTQELRDSFKQEGASLPKNFFCWIVRSSPVAMWGARYLRVSDALPHSVDMSNDPLTANSTAGMWGIGELLIVWFFTRRSDIGFRYDPDELIGGQLWPRKYRTMPWPPPCHFASQASLAAAIDCGLWEPINDEQRLSRERPEITDSPGWMTEHSHASNNDHFVLGRPVVELEEILQAAQRILAERPPPGS